MKISYTDVIIIGMVLLFSFGGYVFAGSSSGGGKTAVIEVDGEIFGRYPMKESITVDVNGKNTVEITESYVRVIYADCPDKSDVKQGKIENGGQVIVCLPNKMTVRIEGGKTEYDAVSS